MNYTLSKARYKGEFPRVWTTAFLRCHYLHFRILHFFFIFISVSAVPYPTHRHFLGWFFSFFYIQYNRSPLDKTKSKWKIFYKERTKKETRKYSTSTNLTALWNRTVKKVGRGWTPYKVKITLLVRMVIISDYSINSKPLL